MLRKRLRGHLGYEIRGIKRVVPRIRAIINFDEPIVFCWKCGKQLDRDEPRFNHKARLFCMSCEDKRK